MKIFGIFSLVQTTRFIVNRDVDSTSEKLSMMTTLFTLKTLRSKFVPLLSRMCEVKVIIQILPRDDSIFEIEWIK